MFILNNSKCNNGYTGPRCDYRTGLDYLYVNGYACSGNGYINNPFVDIFTIQPPTIDQKSKATCLCKTDFYGDSCQYKVNECGASQSISSKPLIHTDIEQKTTI